MTTETRSEEPTQEGPEVDSESRMRHQASVLAECVDSLNTGDKLEVERLLCEHSDIAADLREDLRMLARVRRALERSSC